MRLEELILRIPGDEFRMRFHDQFTVLCGIGMLEREALVDGLLSAMSGMADNSVLTYSDRTGRPVEIVSTGGTPVGRYLDDDSPTLPIIGTLAPNHDALRSLLLLQAADLGLSPDRTSGDDDPELVDARAMLSSLAKELHEAVEQQRSDTEVRTELAHIESQLEAAEDDTARREYGRVLSELERVRAEAATLQAGVAGAETDRHLLEFAEEARTLAQEWEAAHERLEEILERFGQAERLDDETVAQLRWVPDQPPSNLNRLISDASDARRQRDSIESRLRDLATAVLPEPSQPRVVDLATLDQDALWIACHRAVDSASQLEHQQLAHGGIATEGATPAIVEEIESAHTAVIQLEEAIERRRLPTVAGTAIAAVMSLMLAAIAPMASILFLGGACCAAGIGLAVPRRRLSKARAREVTALEPAGTNSYLGFHIRRVDAATTPGGQQRLEEAVRRHRSALVEWSDLAAGLDPVEALTLEPEVREYAAALFNLGDAAGELETLRADLERAEPNVADARDRLAEALGAYGLDASVADNEDPQAIEHLVFERVALGRVARVQDDVEDAEAEEQKMGNRLDDLLHQLGFRDGTLEARIGALEWAVARAAERDEARMTARPRDEIEEDLVRLQNEAARLRRPEWASMPANEAEQSDVVSLTRRRDELQTQLENRGGGFVDVDALADRHAALERRVAALEARQESTPIEASVTQVADVQQYLLAHLTRAAHVGPQDESLPVVLDEPFVRIGAERKWELLDMLRRMGEKTQLVYLTDDPFVGAWARRRAAAGLITLLEPIEA